MGIFRELAIFIYLFFVWIIFNIFKVFPLQNKTTFVTSFTDNIESLVLTLNEKMKEQQELIVLKKSKIDFRLNNSKKIRIIQYDTISHFIQSVYHLATSRYIFVDNYYGFLAATNFKKGVTCIQIWHAVGGFKEFGLTDKSIEKRTTRSINRFKKVYSRFDKVTVGSDYMIQVFHKSLGLPYNRMITTGIPRTDFFFNENDKTKALNKLHFDIPITKEKKVILYAPTYRDGEFNQLQIFLDVEALYSQFKDEYVILLRLHPSVKNSIKSKYPKFIYDVSQYFSINHLLLGTDILITDYSSITVEFSLLNRPMIFFAYDLEQFKQDRGLFEKYEDIVPGPIAKSTSKIIQIINENDYQIEKVRPYAKKWAQYCHGNSSEKIIEAIYNSNKIQ